MDSDHYAAMLERWRTVAADIMAEGHDVPAVAGAMFETAMALQLALRGPAEFSTVLRRGAERCVVLARNGMRRSVEPSAHH